MFRILATVLTTVILAGFLGWMHPGLDAVSNFRLHLSVLLLGTALCLLLTHRRRTALSGITVGAIGIWMSAGALPKFTEPARAAADGSVYRLLHLNLWVHNQQTNDVLQLVDDVDAHILTFVEATRSWQKRLKPLEKRYRHVHRCNWSSTSGGVVIYSRLPMVGGSRSCHEGAIMALAKIKVEHTSFTVGAVHLSWPWPWEGAGEVTALKKSIAGIGENAVIAGDFNSASWTYLIRQFASYGGLSPVQNIGPTWIADSVPAKWATLFGLQPDNIMHKGRIRASSAHTLRPVGSDHLPILFNYTVDG
ncbi:MAG: endonuclease/exonuclease/phosphatase family protein [Stappiaceae bacterium]